MTSDSQRPEEFYDLREFLSASGVTRADVSDVLAAKEVVAEFEATRRRRRTLVGVGVAASIAVVVVALPALNSSEHSAAIALVEAQPLQFPVTIERGVESFPAPEYELDGDLQIARYSNSQGTMTVAVGGEHNWSVPNDAASVSVGADEGRLFKSNNVAHLVWLFDGDWVGVSGRGAYAQTASLLSVARGITDVDTRVDLRIGLSPQGWDLTAYKSDRMLTFAGPDAQEVTLTFGSAQVGDLADDYGATDIQSFREAGTTGEIGTSPEGDWVLTGITANQQAFALNASSDLSRAQVVELASSVE